MSDAQPPPALEPTQPIGRRPRTRWVVVLGAALVVALLSVSWLQLRQGALLRQAVDLAEESLLPVHQIETEYLRLRDEWNDTALAPDVPALRQRHAAWATSLAALRDERILSLLADDPAFEQTRERLESFARRSAAALAAQPVDAAALRELSAGLGELEPPIHGLTLRAARHLSAHAAARNATVQQHNRIGIAMTVSLSALTLAFALLALRQMRQLERRRAALEDLAEHLRQARREAESASEAKSVFLANMSHEIRTPFHGLLGMLALLRDTGLSAQQIGYLRTATESADHLLAILNDILDMSQLETGRMLLSPAPVELRALLRDVDGLMRPQAAAKSLALQVAADPALPERVLCDGRRVKQVLFNLLSNAIKFSDRGTVSLDVRAGDAGATPELVFTVGDEGVGIDEATMATLFRRFVQGDGSRARRHGGTGLGLEISRNLARLMGGDITVHSRPGVGSRFTFTLPLRVVAAPQPADAPAGEAPSPPSRRLRVLVAEDHPVNRDYIAALLERLGHDAVFAVNGIQAVEAMGAAADAPFDIVLMDLHMPEMDGIEATRAIRALPDAAAATVPIVALTADAFAETRDRCLVAGMNDFLTKPVSPQKLASSLRRLFGSGGAVEFAPPPAPQARPAPADAQPLVDAAALEQALQAMSRERLAQMVHQFLDDGPRLAQRLRAAVRDAQPQELGITARAARGAALNLGLSALADTAGALHDGASHLAAHEIARQVQRFEDLLPATREAALAAGLPRPATATDERR